MRRHFKNSSSQQFQPKMLNFSVRRENKIPQPSSKIESVKIFFTVIFLWSVVDS